MRSTLSLAFVSMALAVSGHAQSRAELSATKPSVAAKPAPAAKLPPARTVGARVTLSRVSRLEEKLPIAISTMIEAVPAARSAHWGIHVVDLETGQTVYEQNAQKFFVPASNTKLFSTALALMRLGPDHKFITKVKAGGPVANGVLRGDLRLIGAGDPNLSGRVFPYSNDAKNAGPTGIVGQMADQVAAKGITRITGDILGDDTVYPFEPFPPGWGLGDPVYEYGAPVSALTIGDNTLSLTVRPGVAAGELPSITLDPPVEYFEIENDMRTVETGMAFPSVDRDIGSRIVRLSGTILKSSSERTYRLAIDDPALYAAVLLKDALERRGIRVEGTARAVHRTPSRRSGVSTDAPWSEPAGTELARIESRTLAEALKVVNKESQNLHAELMLRAGARAKTGDGDRRRAVEELQKFLTEIGVPEKTYDFYDGSGLSRLTLVQPVAVTGLLKYLWTTPHRDLVLDILPQGGVDGTLASRFGGSNGNGKDPKAASIRAKTGSLTHVAALGGYSVEGSRKLAFSIVVNNYEGPSTTVRQVIDKIALLLAE
jgi:serine-type D-Ala-D-Ala carboxypeptidase/endopeptidase (penicillin-binding protein 4)